jgi:5-methylcytosine-specific restriction endonuclease McrA
MKRKPTTPKSQVKSSLRRTWLRSRERQAALKRDKYSCCECGIKQSRAKGREVYVEVHHSNGIEWEKIVEYIYRHLLVPPEELETLCKGCHEKIRYPEGKE